MELEGLGIVFLGAPEMLLDSEVPEAREALERGSRVLVLALSQEKLDHHKPQKPSDIQALALLEILDPIREEQQRRWTISVLRRWDSRLSLVTIQLRCPALPRRLVCGLSQLCRLLKNHR